MDKFKSEGRTRTQTLIEKGAKDFLGKFALIDQVFQKLESEELNTREKLRRCIVDLQEEVTHAEQKHKKIQDFLKTFNQD